jgi:hypothetical protein
VRQASFPVLNDFLTATCRYPPFVSNSVSFHLGLYIVAYRVKRRWQRHVTRQKILNWKQSLRFPPKPRVSHEGIDLMQQLLCEPEDRIGSQASSSTARPNSLVVQARRSGFVDAPGSRLGVDGAELIKVRVTR